MPNLTNTGNSFGVVSRLFHWSIALLILGLTGLGWYMVELTYYDPLYHDSLTWHKTYGLVVLFLVAAKIAWRFVTPMPGHLPSLTDFEVKASTAMHHVLWVLMILMPVSGYAISTSQGDGIEMWGLFEVPAVAAISDASRDLAIEIHYWLAYGGLALVGLHAAAALKHHFISRDATLKRMTWG